MSDNSHISEVLKERFPFLLTEGCDVTSEVCERCSKPYERHHAICMGRDVSSPMCNECLEAEHEEKKRQEFWEKMDKHWQDQIPYDYRRAAPDRVHPKLKSILEWQPTEACPRLGITGPVGCGKSMTAALVMKDLGLWFRWTNGFAARTVYNTSVCGSDGERREAGSKWRTFKSCDLLVLDDIDKGNFTEAWASALFDILEERNSRCAPIVWTANHGPGSLARKFSSCGDPELADALERRLCGGAHIISLTKADIKKAKA